MAFRNIRGKLSGKPVGGDAQSSGTVSEAEFRGRRSGGQDRSEADKELRNKLASLENELQKKEEQWQQRLQESHALGTRLSEEVHGKKMKVQMEREKRLRKNSESDPKPVEHEMLSPSVEVKVLRERVERQEAMLEADRQLRKDLQGTFATMFENVSTLKTQLKDAVTVAAQPPKPSLADLQENEVKRLKTLVKRLQGEVQAAKQEGKERLEREQASRESAEKALEHFIKNTVRESSEREQELQAKVQQGHERERQLQQRLNEIRALLHLDNPDGAGAAPGSVRGDAA